ncbi:MAG: tyrosine-type recombinase/integrase [Acidimicrobiales bacterium]
MLPFAEEQEGRTDPAADLEMPKVPKGPPKALSEPEVAALESVQGDDPIARRDRAILEVLYGTGLRISELVGLSLGDLDLDAGLLRAFGKGAKERIVPVGRFATASLVAWLGAGGCPRPRRLRARRGDAEALFLNTRGGRLSRQGA